MSLSQSQMRLGSTRGSEVSGGADIGIEPEVSVGRPSSRRRAPPGPDSIGLPPLPRSDSRCACGARVSTGIAAWRSLPPSESALSSNLNRYQYSRPQN